MGVLATALGSGRCFQIKDYRGNRCCTAAHPGKKTSSRGLITVGKWSSSSQCKGLTGAVELSGPDAEHKLRIKQELGERLSGENRGIFGLKAAKRTAIVDLLSDLEALNPLPSPTEHLEILSGDWLLLFSTISILGSRRTKLGLRSFISLGDFVQTIDIQASSAINRIDFSVAGFDALMGALSIRASYTPVSPVRVNIKFKESTMAPEKLHKLFEENYDLLLSIFNPEGWLDTTYLDETHRIGRDDKGNLFYLERRQ